MNEMKMVPAPLRAVMVQGTEASLRTSISDRTSNLKGFSIFYVQPSHCEHVAVGKGVPEK